jgi:cytochrome P450
MEAALVLATIAQRFRLVAVRDRVVRPEPGVILAPEGGLRMRLEAR